MLVLFFNHFERVSGLRASSLLFVFWTVLTMCCSITFRSKVLYHIYNYNKNNNNQENKSDVDLTDVYVFYVFFALCLANLVLFAFSEKYCENYDNDVNGTKAKLSPENTTSLLSKLSFLWIDPLIRKGFRRDLTREDMWEIDFSETSECVTNKLEFEWNQTVFHYNKKVNQIKQNKIKLIAGFSRHSLVELRVI